jgi:hypothetical protein
MPLFEPLRLKPSFIENDREFLINAATRGAEGARSIEDPELRRRAFVIAATNFRRAGAHSLLLGEFDAARKMFGSSAHAYYDARFPYATMMEILAGPSGWRFDDSTPLTRHSQGFEDLPHQRVYDLVAAAIVPGMRDEAFSAARNFSLPRSIPLGVLGIPLGDFVDLATALATGEGVRQAVTPFLQTYNRAIERAAANTHQWDHLAMAFHPAEPDIVSVLHCVRASRRIAVGELVESTVLNEIAGILARELFGAF